MSRAENAVMRLYEDASLRGDLTDEPADRLLKWAEDKLIALDETAEDDAAFEAGAESILASVRQVNQQVGDTLSAGDPAEFGALAVVADEMTLVETLINRLDNPEAFSAEAVPDQIETPEEPLQPSVPIPPILPTPEEALPHLDIVLNPALTSFFTGQPASSEPAPADPIADDSEDETDDDDSQE